MPRGRLSATAGGEGTPTSQVNDPSESATPAPGGRVTRSRASLNHSRPSSVASSVAKRPRGRPSRASLLAHESGPSASATTDVTSPSEYSTPATSTEPTPAPSVATDGPAKAGVSSTRGGRLVVELPSTGKASSLRDSRRGRYSMDPASKRKTSIPDSEDENDELTTPNKAKATSLKAARRSRYSLNPVSKKSQIPNSDEEEELLSDAGRDEMFARELQEEEYQNAGLSPSSDEAPAPPVSRKRGRPSRASVAEQKRPAKKAKTESHPARSNESTDDDDFVVDDSEADDDSDDPSDKKTRPGKAAKGKNASLSKLPARRTGARSTVPSAPPVGRSAWLEDLDLGDVDGEALYLGDLDLGDVDREDTELEYIDGEGLDGEDGESLHLSSIDHNSDFSDLESENVDGAVTRVANNRRGFGFRGGRGGQRRRRAERDRLETSHPELKTMWSDLEAKPKINAGRAQQPQNISRQLKGFQLEGLAWMKEMERQEWKGGLLGDEMGLGKTIQAVSLIMSDWPAKQPTLVLVPPVALMQWSSEISSYTGGNLKTFVFHTTNAQTKGMTVKKLKEYNVIMMSYNSLESMYRKQEKGFKRGDSMRKEKSLIHQIRFHRVILDEAHCIKTRTTMTAKACFALNVNFRWCLTGTPLQNRIGEFFSLIRFLNVQPFASYLCKQCKCSSLEWSMNADSYCNHCGHAGMQHVSVFNQELLNPIQKYGNLGPGADALRKLRLMTDRIMLRRLKKDHTDSMDLPVKEIQVDRQFFSEVENDFANSIMTNSKRKFETYVAQGVLLNNYANIFGLIMQMRQVANHPDLLLKKSAEGGQNVLVCCICDEPAEDAIRSRCKHDFCRACAKGYLNSSDKPDCPQCHIPLSIDLEQPEMEQDESLVKKSSIINRIKMENWTSSSKIELLVRDLHKLRSDKASHKSIIFSQFTSMLQLIEWRLRRAGITTVMLDGSMSPAQRQASIDHFMNTPEVECFLVSLKAGGVALNLTEASRVFIVDPWWNPAAEWQSADRCHRIGQTRPCNITRLCIEDSVESRMVLIQEKKTSMIHSTVNADDKAMEALTPQDMQFLFRGS